MKIFKRVLAVAVSASRERRPYAVYGGWVRALILTLSIAEGEGSR